MGGLVVGRQSKDPGAELCIDRGQLRWQPADWALQT